MSDQPQFEFRFRPSFDSLSPLRGAIRRSMAQGVTPAEMRDVLLVVSELVTNAIEAVDGKACDIKVRIATVERTLSIEVEDCGVGFSLRNHRPVTPADETGRGLAIVSTIASEVHVDRHRRHTVVRALLRTNEALQLTGDLQ